MRSYLKLLPLLLLAGCSAPQDQAYCDSFHLPKGSQEYALCMSHFARMDEWFKRDAAECHSKAVAAFPDYMYDHPRYAQTTGFDYYGYSRTHGMIVEPDYVRNSLLDKERHKIADPCMLAKGWLSATDWQAGRRSEDKRKVKRR